MRAARAADTLSSREEHDRHEMPYTLIDIISLEERRFRLYFARCRAFTMRRRDDAERAWRHAAMPAFDDYIASVV